MPAALLPPFLLDEIEARESGVGASVAIPPGSPCNVTLAITRVLPHESLDVSIWGAGEDGDWVRLASFPNKCYCGTYSMPLQLGGQSHVTRLRAEWKMSRWSQPGATPLFGFFVALDDRRTRHAGAA